MSVQGKWRVVEIPDYEMAVSGAYILFAPSKARSASITATISPS